MAAQPTVHSLSSQLAPQVAPPLEPGQDLRRAPKLAAELVPELAPELADVLSGLTVSLDAELNRYRRNRRLDSFGRSLAREDIFADVESDPAFDLEPIETALVTTPPPVPPNKKLIAIQASRFETSAADLPDALSDSKLPKPNATGSNLLALRASTQQGIGKQPKQIEQATNLGQTDQLQPDGVGLDAPISALLSPAARPVADPTLNPATGPAIDPAIDPATGRTTGRTTGQATELTTDSIAENDAIAPSLTATTPNLRTAHSYLTSSKALIETLENPPAQPDAAEPTVRPPRRKTVSLLAGATVALLGLIGGLVASYFMSDPLVAQRLASGLQDDSVEANPSTKAFDPPGPDLSGAEFIELEIGNLSSLKMPQTALLNPGELPPAPTLPTLASPTPAPPVPAPPVPAVLAPAAQSPQATIPVIAAPPADTSSANRQLANQQSGSRQSIPSQSVMLPVGLTYYVTIPFTSESGLNRIRQTIDEAFVRRFSTGNRIQVAAFDNAQSAQQFITELKEKNINAEVYGPTTE